ncbi:LysE family translocator [Bauldia litoralis]|uniref:Threonine/homoserine/homoserine lactone efflux protein n=1 Tax=Bauldia litoralis TaxID=665467 RepID=A0A1G6D7X4_9HYPH|nr:LysE family translocator [Bauldia litoralis]SDB41200.1 Threonine/homoserine/homoserine lactone efflux protein [Bauldia litoralis]
MTPDTLLPLLGFVVAFTATPGPNNLMVLVSGANWGLKRTVPHIVGIALGFPLMIIAVGLGLGQVFEAYPLVHDVLKYIAFAYLLFLAWRIAQAGKPQTTSVRSRPLNLFEAMAFQWVNPKAWALVLGATALFTTPGGDPVVEIGVMALMFGLVCLPNGIVWALFGKAIARFLSDDRRRRIFNVSMAVLLVASVLPALF